MYIRMIKLVSIDNVIDSVCMAEHSTLYKWQFSIEISTVSFFSFVFHCITSFEALYHFKGGAHTHFTDT